MPEGPPLPDLTSVREAADRIRREVVRTSVRGSAWLAAATGARVQLKLEIEQPTGSFKVRGACNAIRVMLERGDLPGVTTASTGNHARAVAYLGDLLGVPVRAFMSDTVSPHRVQALEELGATVDRSCHDQTAAIVAARRFATEHGYGFVPPFDHPDVISGQGTIGLELCRQVPDLDAVVVPVSGGGLIGGIGLAVKAIRPEVTVIGVGARQAPAMQRSLAAGHPVPVPELPTVATSLMGDLGPGNRYTFRIAQRVIDRMVAVTDEQLLRATDRLREEDGLVVEPAAAAGAAFLAGDGHAFRGRSVALILTGNAVEPH